jgi:hypothetical protein
MTSSLPFLPRKTNQQLEGYLREASKRWEETIIVETRKILQGNSALSHPQAKFFEEGF